MTHDRALALTRFSPPSTSSRMSRAVACLVAGHRRQLQAVELGVIVPSAPSWHGRGGGGQDILLLDSVCRRWRWRLSPSLLAPPWSALLPLSVVSWNSASLCGTVAADPRKRRSKWIVLQSIATTHDVVGCRRLGVVLAACPPFLCLTGGVALSRPSCHKLAGRQGAAMCSSFVGRCCTTSRRSGIWRSLADAPMCCGAWLQVVRPACCWPAPTWSLPRPSSKSAVSRAAPQGVALLAGDGNFVHSGARGCGL